MQIKLPSSSSAPSELYNDIDVIIGGGRYRESEHGPDKFVVAHVDTSSASIKLATSNFFPHGFVFTRQDKNLAYGFEKIGAGAGLFDLEKMQLLASIKPVKNRLFYGHGICSKDDKLLYSTETTATGDGAIGVRDTSNLDYLGDFPTFGSHPHDCHLLEDGTVLAVSNAGGTKESGQRGSICYIDIQSERLIERIEMPDERFNTGHFYPLQGCQSIVVSAPRRGLGDDHLGAISMQAHSPTLDLIAQPSDVVENIFGEALSVLAIPDQDIFVVTHPIPGMVTFWQLNSRKKRKVLKLPKARGLAITNDQKGVWISYGPQAELIRVDFSDLKIVRRINNTYLTGSHLYKI